MVLSSTSSNLFPSRIYLDYIFFYMLLLWGNIAKLALGYGCHSGVMESTTASPWVFMLGARAWTWQHFTVLVTEFVTSYLLCCCLDFDRKVTKKRQDQLRIGNKAPRVWLTYKRQGNGCSLTLCPPPPSPHCSLMHSTAQYSAGSLWSTLFSCHLATQFSWQVDCEPRQSANTFQSAVEH